MSKNDENQDQKITGLFDDGFELFQQISKSDEPTNSGKVQILIRKSIDLLEDSTKLVSLIGIFSSNEDIDEVATADLKLLLLPALLGQLTLKLFSENRSNIIETAEIYFKDFLQRCRDYRITDYDIRNNDEEKDDQSSSSSEAVALPHKNSAPDLFKMAQDRNKKLQRYREQKALEEELSKLKEITSHCNCDEDLKRKYFLSLVKSFVNQSIDEIKSIEMEKPILEHMAKVRSPGTMANNELENKMTKPVLNKPLKAVIITKDEVQKHVFGYGYPSLPRMSVQEFYDSRVQDGTFVMKPTVRISLQDHSSKDEETKKQEEIEAGIQETLIEQDDSEELARARAMDEYKDEFKRGWGNRYNRS